MLLLDAKIMRVDVRAKLDFLHLVGVLVFARFLIPLGLFVAEFAKIHQSANRRHSLRVDFDQIHLLGAGQIDRIA